MVQVSHHQLKKEKNFHLDVHEQMASKIQELNHNDFYFPSMQVGSPSILLKDGRESNDEDYSSNGVISLEKFRKSKADKT